MSDLPNTKIPRARAQSRLLHVIEAPLSGWGPNDFSLSNSGPVEVPMESPINSRYYSKSGGISLFQIGKYGHIAPGEAFVALTDGSTKVNQLPVNGVVDSAGEAFVILKNARVVQFGVGDDTVDAHNATAHGGHANLVGEDILNYKDVTDEYILYSFRDDTDWDVGRRVKSSGTYTDSWLSALGTQTNDSGEGARTFNKGVPHKMILGPDNDIYITNGRYLASHTPGSSEVNYKAFDLGAGFIATGLALDGNFLVISGYLGTTYLSAYSRSVSRIYYWNTYTDGFTKMYDMGDNYIGGIKHNGRRLIAFTQGKDGTTKIQTPGAGNFGEVLFESGQIGNAPTHGSMDMFGGWLHYAGDGSQRLNCVGPNGEYHFRTVPTVDGISTPTELGMVKNLSTNKLYVGVSIGGSYKIYQMNSGNGLYYMNTSFRSGLMKFGYRSTIDRFRVFFSQFGTGASVTLSFFKNYSTMSVGGADDLLNEAITFTNEGAIAEYTLDRTIPDVSAGYLNAYFNHAAYTSVAAVIRRIEIWGHTPDKV